ncbi:aspartate aminotransferase [Pochonia chlamydosporia 170]|uniref:Aspartate aminotransferase n=1 Tax=Pochonia chlamydosporia 170 TaxID=1380566 RepID=A0A179FU91_METCM|nr:aspartate aminotransferase [Pochonia chlamydosporia 170]OAQ68770.2 aspartate aminotransferase [Pochonia chlamydosporia 170]
MDNIKDFPLDNWIREQSPNCKVAFHASCSKTLSINELCQLSATPGTEAFDRHLKLDYGPFEGSTKLRSRIAEMHSTPETPLTADNVIITPGSILANYLVLQTLCKKGDHIICQYPSYGQLYLLPRHHGVDITLWAMEEAQNWLPDVNKLAGMIRPNTKAIILNNPNNPIGTILSRNFLEKVVDVAKKSNIAVFCDEVFTPLFHTEDPAPPPVVSLGYDNSVSTGSLSKAYGLPGVRVGWVVSRNATLLRKILVARDYTTISVSQLDDSVAAYALSRDVCPNLLKRNLELCKESITVLDDFVRRNKRCRWTKPQGGGTGFIQIFDDDGQPVDDYEVGLQIVKEQGLLVVPCGFCFREEGTSDFKGYLRFPLGDPDVLREGLPLLEKFLNN